MDSLWVLVLQNLMYIEECVRKQHNYIKKTLSMMQENQDRLQLLCEHEAVKSMYDHFLEN